MVMESNIRREKWQETDPVTTCIIKIKSPWKNIRDCIKIIKSSNEWPREAKLKQGKMEFFLEKCGRGKTTLPSGENILTKKGRNGFP